MGGQLGDSWGIVGGQLGDSWGTVRGQFGGQFAGQFDGGRFERMYGAICSFPGGVGGVGVAAGCVQKYENQVSHPQLARARRPGSRLPL